MHVRLSVRVHHISFLHPGLDAGGATLTTNRGKSKTWLPTKNDTPAGAPGPMAFGPRRGSWKNPTKNKAFRRGSSADDTKHPGNYMKEETVTAAMDAAEVSEIISSEAYRLSRDGIIQQHYALMRQQQPVMGVTSPRAADLSETARYYKECANRPKGYRRIVVSSMIPMENDKIPSPPVKKSNVFSKKMVDGAGFDKASSMPEEEEDTFDNVEYRYVGPPNVSFVCLNSFCFVLIVTYRSFCSLNLNLETDRAGLLRTSTPKWRCILRSLSTRSSLQCSQTFHCIRTEQS
jgi:hypothetical protein